MRYSTFNSLNAFIFSVILLLLSSCSDLPTSVPTNYNDGVDDIGSIADSVKTEKENTGLFKTTGKTYKFEVKLIRYYVIREDDPGNDLELWGESVRRLYKRDSLNRNISPISTKTMWSRSRSSYIVVDEGKSYPINNSNTVTFSSDCDDYNSLLRIETDLTERDPISDDFLTSGIKTYRLRELVASLPYVGSYLTQTCYMDGFLNDDSRVKAVWRITRIQ